MTTRFTDHLLEGTHAELPDPGTTPVGALFSCTEHGLIYKNDGTTWATWATLGAGAEVIRDTMAATLVAGENVTITPDDAGDTIAITSTGGGAGGGGSRVDDPAEWGPDLGYDLEFDTDDASGALPTGWSWVNQGTSTYEQRLGAGIITPQGGGARLIVRTLPTESEWTATVKLGGGPPNTGLVGLALREAATGKYTNFHVNPLGDGRFTVTKTNRSSPGAYISGSAVASENRHQDRYLRVARSAANTYTLSSSSDCLAWHTVVGGMAPYVAYDQIGLEVELPSGATTQASFHWFRVR